MMMAPPHEASGRSPGATRSEDDQPDGAPHETTDAGEEPDIHQTVYRSEDVSDVEELAEAERAAARHAATPDQVAGVAAAAEVRRTEDRLEQWQGRHRG
jgi:hypothetical protein